jgi:hypothetical protein
VPDLGESLNPQNWRLDVDPRCVDLYLGLCDSPRPLSAEECELLIGLVDGWRAGEHRKHIALMRALEMLDPPIALEIVRENVEQFGGDA